MSVEVTKAYTSQYPDPICFDVGAVVQVQRDDPEYPGWFWCRGPSGKAGWVHRSPAAEPEIDGITADIRLGIPVPSQGNASAMAAHTAHANSEGKGKSPGQPSEPVH